MLLLVAQTAASAPASGPAPIQLDWVAAVSQRLVPGQGAALWIGLLVTFLVAGDHRRLLSRRNLTLAALLAMAPLLLDSVRWCRPQSTPALQRLNAWVFAAIFALTAAMAAWALLLALRPARMALVPNVPRPGLRVLLVLVLALDVVTVLGRAPDDCGYYTSLGAQRWVETGRLPYTDPLLKGEKAPGNGAAATYGPLLYAAHLPFQAVLRRPRNAADADPNAPGYRRPGNLATQLCCLTFHLLGLVALWRVARRLATPETALALVALYGASPYVLGLGGNDAVIGGLAYISHIAPTACVLLALAAVEVPWLAGVCLALGAGVLYWPAFLFPAWLGWYLWNRKGALPFLLGFGATALLVVGLVWQFTPASSERGFVGLFLESTLEHQEGTAAGQYGASTLSFWGTHPQLAWWQTPLFGGGSLFKPTFLCFAALCGATFVLARGRDVLGLAALTAVVGAAVQLWKTHASGTYVEWYWPFLLLALFAGPPRGAAMGEVHMLPADGASADAERHPAGLGM